MKHTFFHAPKNIQERIEDELAPLESAFHTMLKQESLKPETRKKLEQNLEAFSHFREKTKKIERIQPSKFYNPLLSP